MARAHVFCSRTDYSGTAEHISTFISISSLHFVLKNGCNQHAAHGVDLWCLSFSPLQHRGGGVVCKLCSASLAPPHCIRRVVSFKRASGWEYRTRVGTSGASKIQTFIVSMSGNLVHLLLRQVLTKKMYNMLVIFLPDIKFGAVCWLAGSSVQKNSRLPSTICSEWKYFMGYVKFKPPSRKWGMSFFLMYVKWTAKNTILGRNNEGFNSNLSVHVYLLLK